jgi:hypothetical protein
MQRRGIFRTVVGSLLTILISIIFTQGRFEAAPATAGTSAETVARVSQTVGPDSSPSDLPTITKTWLSAVADASQKVPKVGEYVQRLLVILGPNWHWVAGLVVLASLTILLWLALLLDRWLR